MYSRSTFFADVAIDEFLVLFMFVYVRATLWTVHVTVFFLGYYACVIALAKWKILRRKSLFCNAERERRVAFEKDATSVSIVNQSCCFSKATSTTFFMVV